MSTYPRDQRFMADAVFRYGQAGQADEYRKWLKQNPNVLSVPTDAELPPYLATYAVSSLTAAAEEMEKTIYLDEDIASDQENDRLLLAEIVIKLKNDFGINGTWSMKL